VHHAEEGLRPSDAYGLTPAKGQYRVDLPGASLALPPESLPLTLTAQREIVFSVSLSKAMLRRVGLVLWSPSPGRGEVFERARSPRPLRPACWPRSRGARPSPSSRKHRGAGRFRARAGGPSVSGPRAGGVLGDAGLPAPEGETIDYRLMEARASRAATSVVKRAGVVTRANTAPDLTSWVSGCPAEQRR
jgi:hypothetical protein